MIETIKIEWDLLGAKLAALSDQEQAKFFIGFAHELSKYESKYSVGLQLCFVNAKLDKKTKDILEEFLPYLYSREEK